MPKFHYRLEGTFEAPKGSSTPDGSSIQLPDKDGKSRIIKIWECFELHLVGKDESEDNTHDLTFDELQALGCFYDGPTSEIWSNLP